MVNNSPSCIWLKALKPHKFNQKIEVKHLGGKKKKKKKKKILKHNK